MSNVVQLKSREDEQTGIVESEYAKCIEVSKRIRWDIERDVIRGRRFDFSRKFLPDALTKIDVLPFLDQAEQRLLSQIQGRTYANMFALIERYIVVKMLDVSRGHSFGNQIALEALVRFTDEELKHQALFRRIEQMIAPHMPEGYRFDHQPNEVASFVLGKSTWAVLALTCLVELVTQVHYRAGIAPAAEVSPLFKDAFLFHWKEESQHAILDEIEWRREDAGLNEQQRDAAVDDLIALAAGVDGIVQAQARADCDYFLRVCGRPLSQEQSDKLSSTVLYAYRWQYIVSGAEDARFSAILGSMITERQAGRIAAALEPIATFKPH